MPNNQIKVTQIDNDDLLAFLQASMGLTIGVAKTSHTREEVFTQKVSLTGPLLASGLSTFSRQAVFESGIFSEDNIYAQGLISGQSIKIDNFNIPSGVIGTVNIGSMKLTGVPIYDSGSVATAVLLPSGTVFGIKQEITYNAFEKDASGNLMPYTGIPTTVVMLCVSIGS